MVVLKCRHVSAAMHDMRVRVVGVAASFSKTTMRIPPLTTRPVAGSGSCVIYDSGQDARILVISGGQPECSALARSLSGSGDFWTVQPQATSDPLSMVCVMDSGGNVAEVIDGGGQVIGQEVCSSFVSAGWTEDTAAEAQARQQEQQQAAAQASASASASQAQARQQQRAQDQQTARTDLSTLEQDAGSSGNLPGDLSNFASDIGSARSDLATEKQDAAGDAQSVDGDLQSMQGDVQSITPDITTVRQDIAALNDDLQTLAGDGLPAPPGAAAAITAARASLSTAIAAANGYIDQGNAIDAQAYALANGMATGSCSGDGPGSPAAPIPHI